jgi:hypothetical protein
VAAGNENAVREREPLSYVGKPVARVYASGANKSYTKWFSNPIYGRLQLAQTQHWNRFCSIFWLVDRLTTAWRSGSMPRTVTEGSFDGPLAKIDRAKHHLCDARAEEVRFFENHAEIKIDRNTKTGIGLAKIVSSLPPPPFKMPILASEIIHHIRSALDNSLTAAARKSGLTEEEIGNFRHFPVGKNQADFDKKCAAHLKNIDPKFVNVIKSSRNFNGGDDDLYAIFTASNWDKHWELITTTPIGAPTGLDGYTVSGGAILNIGTTGNLQNGIMSGYVPAGGNISPNHPNAHVPVSGSFAIKGLGVCDGKEITPMLAAAISSAENIISQLVKLT